MSDDPNYDPATTAAAEAPSQPIPPAVQSALDAAIARIEALEKFLVVDPPTTPSPGPFTNTPATFAASEAVATDPLVKPEEPTAPPSEPPAPSPS